MNPIRVARKSPLPLLARVISTTRVSDRQRWGEEKNPSLRPLSPPPIRWSIRSVVEVEEESGKECFHVLWETKRRRRRRYSPGDVRMSVSLGCLNIPRCCWKGVGRQKLLEIEVKPVRPIFLSNNDTDEGNHDHCKEFQALPRWKSKFKATFWKNRTFISSFTFI